MTRRRLLHGVLVLAAVATVAEVALGVHFGQAHPRADAYPYLIEGLTTAPVFFGLTWLLVARRPDLSITAVFAAAVGFGALQGVSGAYGHEALLGHDLPAGVLALTVSYIAQGVGVIATLLLLNLFPTGAPVTARWRVTIHLCAAAAMTTFAAPWFAASPFGDTDSVRQLAGVPGLLHEASPGWAGTAAGAANVVAPVVLVMATLAHLVVRFRRSRGIERQQLRVFVYAVLAGVTIIVVPWNLLVEAVTGMAVPDWLAWSIGPAVIWAGMGAAVLRHRLYDIDRVVSRTVTWTIATALLLGLYLGVVVTLQTLLRPVTLGGDLPVAVATLAVAAGARPMLVRVRRVVDRRFNRARYDAARTVEAFGRELRDEVGLDAILEDLRSTAVGTVQPASVGVVLVQWPRP